jgi:TRAP-type C4-dicarboxylate transport system permease small subunit
LSGFFSLFDRTVRALTALSGYVAGLLILLVSFMVSYEVFMRGFFNAPTEWSIEISVYLVMASGFLGLAPALAGNNHISVDLLTSKLSLTVNKGLRTFTAIVGLIFCLILTIASADMVLVSYEMGSLSTSTLRIPLYIPQSAIPIGAALIVLEFLRQIFADFSARSATKEGK